MADADVAAFVVVAVVAIAEKQQQMAIHLTGAIPSSGTVPSRRPWPNNVKKMKRRKSPSNYAEKRTLLRT